MATERFIVWDEPPPVSLLPKEFLVPEECASIIFQWNEGDLLTGGSLTRKRKDDEASDDQGKPVIYLHSSSNEMEEGEIPPYIEHNRIGSDVPPRPSPASIHSVPHISRPVTGDTVPRVPTPGDRELPIDPPPNLHPHDSPNYPPSRVAPRPYDERPISPSFRDVPPPTRHANEIPQRHEEAYPWEFREPSLDDEAHWVDKRSQEAYWEPSSLPRRDIPPYRPYAPPPQPPFRDQPPMRRPPDYGNPPPPERFGPRAGRFLEEDTRRRSDSHDRYTDGRSFDSYASNGSVYRMPERREEQMPRAKVPPVDPKKLLLQETLNLNVAAQKSYAEVERERRMRERAFERQQEKLKEIPAGALKQRVSKGRR